MDMSGATRESIYLQCILRDQRLRSVRDLRAEHVPLLERVRDTVLRVAAEKLHCKDWELRLYFHYFPTFWWLHIHVTHVAFPQLGGSTNIGKAILFDDVVQNIQIKSTYYEEAVLSAQVKVGTPHHAAFLAAGHVWE